MNVLKPPASTVNNAGLRLKLTERHPVIGVVNCSLPKRIPANRAGRHLGCASSPEQFPGKRAIGTGEQIRRQIDPTASKSSLRLAGCKSVYNRRAVSMSSAAACRRDGTMSRRLKPGTIHHGHRPASTTSSAYTAWSDQLL